MLKRVCLWHSLESYNFMSQRQNRNGFDFFLHFGLHNLGLPDFFYLLDCLTITGLDRTYHDHHFIFSFTFWFFCLFHVVDQAGYPSAFYYSLNTYYRIVSYSSLFPAINKLGCLPATSVINSPWSVAAKCIALTAGAIHSTQWRHILAQNNDSCLPHLHSTSPLRGFPSEYCHAVWYRKIEWCVYPTVKNFEDMFIRFDRMYQRDRQTDRQTDRRTDRRTPYDG